MFLYGETREVMMHVAGLMPFAPPPDWTPEQMRFLMDEIRERAARMYPLGRLGEPRDIAAMIVFLVSDQTSWVTGQPTSVT
mgnify:CR=1 FL=1